MDLTEVYQKLQTLIREIAESELEAQIDIMLVDNRDKSYGYRHIRAFINSPDDEEY